MLSILVIKAFESYFMEYPKSHFVFSRCRLNPLGESVDQENTSDKWDVPWNTTRKRCITILYHTI